jgi:hypothetical protein
MCHELFITCTQVHLRIRKFNLQTLGDMNKSDGMPGWTANVWRVFDREGAQLGCMLTLILIMWRIYWAPNSIPVYIQQDATLHSLFISGICSTRFGWYFHPSPEAHTTVSTASGIFHAVTAICRYRGRVRTGLSVLWVAYAQTGSNSSTIAADSSNGVTNTRCCRYSCMRSWWWVEILPETHVEQIPDVNKLCNVASCWIYIEIYLRCTNP